MAGDQEKLVINGIGQAGAGKTTLANKMSELYGFDIFRPSDVIRTYAAAHGVTLRFRSDYTTCHAKMLAEDSDAILRPVLRNPNDLVWVDGLRVPAHAEHFRRELGMRTLALDASPEIRFRNIKAAAGWERYRDEAHINSLEDLLADEATDNGNTDPHEANVEAIMAMADYTITIEEDTTLATVHHLASAAVEGWIQELYSCRGKTLHTD